jgi:hypothetical protein
LVAPATKEGKRATDPSKVVAKASDAWYISRERADAAAAAKGAAMGGSGGELLVEEVPLLVEAPALRLTGFNAGSPLLSSAVSWRSPLQQLIVLKTEGVAAHLWVLLVAGTCGKRSLHQPCVA